MVSMIAPSWLLWVICTSRPSSLACSRILRFTSSKVSAPYTSGSRSPSRFRFGPWITAIFNVVVGESCIDDPRAASGRPGLLARLLRRVGGRRAQIREAVLRHDRVDRAAAVTYELPAIL